MRARPGRGHGAAAGHADRSPREGGVCRRWRQRAEAFRVGPRLPPAVTQVVAGRRRLCGGQEVWLGAPRPHVRRSRGQPWRGAQASSLPSPSQEAPRCGARCRDAVPAALRPGVLAPRGGATGPASAVHPDASWPSRPARRPLPPAPRSGIPVTARSKTCQGIFRFKRRKNIPTGDRAALGLREIPDPKNLK